MLVEHALGVAMDRPQHPNVRVHQRSATFGCLRKRKPIFTSCRRETGMRIDSRFSRFWTIKYLPVKPMNLLAPPALIISPPRAGSVMPLIGPVLKDGHNAHVFAFSPSSTRRRMASERSSFTP